MTEYHELLNEFLESWSISRVRNMTLEEYTNLEKNDSFCYWLEKRTENLGSIWGGSSFKFGIYEKDQKEKIYDSGGRLSDNDYAWYSKYGKTREEVFNNVKEIIIQIIEASQASDYSAIDKLDLGDAIKWKIAFLYSDYQIFNTFKKEHLFTILEKLGDPQDKKASFGELQQLILSKKPDTKDFFEYGKEMWELANDREAQYWLYSPGKKGVKMDEFFEEGIMALGMDDIGDLNEYSDEEEIRQALFEFYGSETDKRHDVKANQDFKDEMKTGDIIIAKSGSHSLIGYGIVSSDYYFDDEREDFKKCRKVDWKKEGYWVTPNDIVLAQKALTNISMYFHPHGSTQKYGDYLIKLMEGENADSEPQNKTGMNNKIMNLLKYKKQIILQGPPGTGKTRMAKMMAEELIKAKAVEIEGTMEPVSTEISDTEIYDLLEIGTRISSVAGSATYEIISKDSDSVTLLRGNGTSDKTKFNKIKYFLINDNWNRSHSNNPDRRAAALAKFISENYTKKNNRPSKIEGSGEYKIIQFHPSYTYEDFVRGIVVETDDGIPNYKTANRILAEMAEKALENYNSTLVAPEEFNRREQVKKYFGLFADSIREKLETTDEAINLTENIGIESVEGTAFRYVGLTRRRVNTLMHFKDIIQAYLDGNRTWQDVRYNPNLSGTANRNASYYYRVLNMFRDFLELENLIVEAEDSIKPELKNFVLIIDEINRANLSSVLGELIYALEYRGEDVESMYEFDDSNKLTLPPNLYIIGTMNTADRSVGHIDYAIRRRFAFVDVLPKDISKEESIVFDKGLFEKVKNLFTNDDEFKTWSKYLSVEFHPKDVALGHSYFIDKSEEGGSMDVRLEFEIKPILMEYVKDGVLIGDDIIDEIEKLEASA